MGEAMVSRLFNAKCKRGAALVEMALVLPILLLLTFAVIEYGWMTFRASQVGQAARHGARIAVRPAATVEEIEAAVADIMEGAGLTEYTLTITPEDPATEVGDPVTVVVLVNYGPISLTGSSFVPVPETLVGNVTMAKEGPG
jgi:Flp pilus assembly protein TadG